MTLVATSTDSAGGRYPDTILASYTARDAGNTVVECVVNASGTLDVYCSVDGMASAPTLVSTVSPTGGGTVTQYAIVYNNGRLHLVYVVSNTVRYRDSTDNGANWSAEQTILTGPNYVTIVPTPDVGANSLWVVGIDDNPASWYFTTSSNNGTSWAAGVQRIGVGAGAHITSGVHALYADGQYWLMWENTQSDSGRGFKVARSTDPTFGTKTLDYDGVDENSTSIVVAKATGALYIFRNVFTVGYSVLRRLSGGAWSTLTTTGTATWTAGAVAWQYESGYIDIAYASSGLKRQRFDTSGLSFGAATTIDSEATTTSVCGGIGLNAYAYDLTCRQGAGSPYSYAHQTVTYIVNVTITSVSGGSALGLTTASVEVNISHVSVISAAGTVTAGATVSSVTAEQNVYLAAQAGQAAAAQTTAVVNATANVVIEAVVTPAFGGWTVFGVSAMCHFTIITSASTVETTITASMVPAEVRSS